ncbi:MAG TPA: DUF1080 domain-containing protein [Isosphaeraceae bacterium]|jgi:hypothetical protein
MNPFRRSVPCVTSALAVAALIATAKAASPDADRPTNAPQSLVLFDGKSLAGWKETDFFSPGGVEVRDGAIVLKIGRPMTGITSTRQDLLRTDYELSYEAQRLEGIDFFAAATFPVGSSYVTLVNGGWGGNITGISSIDGADASENATGTSVTYKNGTWYRFRVRVTAAALRVWVDDKKVIDVDIRDSQLRTRIETRANEPLGFATWESAGAIRKVEMRTLTPAEVAEVNSTTSP